MVSHMVLLNTNSLHFRYKNKAGAVKDRQGRYLEGVESEKTKE